MKEERRYRELQAYRDDFSYLGKRYHTVSSTERHHIVFSIEHHYIVFSIEHHPSASSSTHHHTTPLTTHAKLYTNKRGFVQQYKTSITGRWQD